MKRSLQVKVWILLGYVLVCTAILLLEAPDAAPALQPVSLPELQPELLEPLNN